MWREAKKLGKRPSAFTLVELILVVGTIAVVAGALVGLISNSYEDWKLGSNRSTLLQDGQAAIEQMVRIIRQAQAFSAVSQSTDTAGYITFTSIDSVTEEFRLNTGTDELEYGEPASLSALTGFVSSLTFTSYDIDGNVLTGAVSAGSIQSIGIEMTLADADNSFTLSGRVFCPKDFQNLVINEIMYNPPGGSDAAKEWVELYNFGGSSIDLTGWTIDGDTLIAHPTFGNGSMIVPSGGYAVIMTNNAIVFNELTIAGDFENRNQWQNNWANNNWDRTRRDAHNGSYKGESTVNGTGYMYTDISVPASLGSCPFIFWEMTTAPVARTQITATIRNLSNQILETGYSGQMSAAWTYHTMDLSAYAGQNIRICFSSNKTIGSGALLLDDITVASSYVSSSSLILSCGDNQIGNGLGNNSDMVTITDGSATIDSVTYDDIWGGDGDGTSLARIDPQGSSNDEGNWTSGPQNGTPGSAN